LGCADDLVAPPDITQNAISVQALLLVIHLLPVTGVPKLSLFCKVLIDTA
jgi:hypothetical protein